MKKKFDWNFSEMQKNIIGMYCAVRNLNCTQRLARLFEEKFLEQCADSDQMSSDCSRLVDNMLMAD